MESLVGDYLRNHTQAIIARWESDILSQVPQLGRWPRGARVDHLPEFLIALADWIEGRTETAQRGFALLAQGHALQRLGMGVDLDGLSLEHTVLRNVLLHALLEVESSPNVRADLIRVNDGMDRAINESVRLYNKRRDEIRERFIAILGHDLRGPLSAMLMGVDTVLLRNSATLADVAVLKRVSASGARMARMIDDVMDFARGHLGDGIPATPTPTDLGEITRAVVDEIHTAKPAMTFELRVSGDLRGSFDCDRVQQAIGNLISNAIHHGRAPIVVAAREEDRTMLVTEVTNAGEIAGDQLAFLFDPFRGGRDEKAAREGLGLGLFIVRQIALAHGAECTVLSREGVTTFSIRWPRVPHEDVPDRD